MQQQIPPQPIQQPPQYNPGYNPSQNKEIPIWVKVISVFFYIQFAGVAVGLIFLLINVIRLSKMTSALVSTGMVLIYFPVLIGLAVLLFFIARGLWKGKNWTRKGAIILSTIVGVIYILVTIFFVSFLSTVLSLLGGGAVLGILRAVIVIGISAFIAIYLSTKKVKETFH